MRFDPEFTIKCECGSEFLHIEAQDPDCWEDGLFLCIWTLAYHHNGFWHRFRYAWHILRYGTPYRDQICLNYDSVKILYNWLESYVNLTNAKIRQAERELYYERNKVF